MIPMKWKYISKIDPIILQFFMSLTIFVSFPIPMILSSYEMSYYGIIGASIWVPVSCLSIFCVQLIGISIAQTLWSSVSIIISYILGIVLFNEQFYGLVFIILSPILILIGTFIVALSDLNISNNKNIKRKIIGVCLSLFMGLLNGVSMIPLKLNKKGIQNG